MNAVLPSPVDTDAAVPLETYVWLCFDRPCFVMSPAVKLSVTLTLCVYSVRALKRVKIAQKGLGFEP